MEPKEIVPIVQECKLREFPGFYYPNVAARSHIDDEHLIVETFWNACISIVKVNLLNGNVEKIGDLFEKQPHSFFLFDVALENNLICGYISSPTQKPALVVKKFDDSEWKLVDQTVEKNESCTWNWQFVRLNREGRIIFDCLFLN